MVVQRREELNDRGCGLWCTPEGEVMAELVKEQDAGIGQDRRQSMTRLLSN